MTDLSQRRGTSKNRRILFRESDGITPIDITGGVVKVAIKYSALDDNDAAVIMHRSYDPSEILLSNPAIGEALWQIGVGDWDDVEPCEYVWGGELTLRGAIRTSAGAMTAATGSQILTYAGPAIALFETGDIIVANGAINAANQKPITVMDVDTVLSTITTDYDGWVTETFNHDTYVADRPDVSTNLSGSFTVPADAVT